MRLRFVCLFKHWFAFANRNSSTNGPNQPWVIRKPAVKSDDNFCSIRSFYKVWSWGQFNFAAQSQLSCTTQHHTQWLDTNTNTAQRYTQWSCSVKYARQNHRQLLKHFRRKQSKRNEAKRFVVADETFHPQHTVITHPLLFPQPHHYCSTDWLTTSLSLKSI